MTRKPILSRRGFLYGAGGVAVGLPFLEGLQPRKLRAAPPERPQIGRAHV